MSLAGAAREYTALDKVDQQDDAPYIFEPLGIRTSDEIEELWRSMSEMETDFRDTMLRLRQITAEKERMGAELTIATRIQEGTLPKDFPAFPDRTEFDIYASMYPAREVGGDLYDFFLIDEDHLAIVIGDVSGKGISAALFMVIAKTLIKNQTQSSGQDPAEVFANVNMKLLEINKAKKFVTAWMGILTISTGEVTYVNSGHEYPVVRRKGGNFEIEEGAHGAPLAASKRVKFRPGKFTLQPGDTIYMYTDGVSEANNAEGEMFGKDRLLDALNRTPDTEPRIIDEQMHEALASFVQDAPQFDDVTMLCMKYFGIRYSE
jgi:sigma-B regulation protein RsbU (phosphoserine phosphatase)